MQIVNGAYQFILPTAFYPDYQQLGAQNVDSHPYEFAYSVQIKSSKKITFISKPANSNCQPSRDGCRAAIFCKKPSKEICVFYKTEDMKHPSTVYATSLTYPGEIACSMSFVPTFDPPAPQEQQKAIM